MPTRPDDHQLAQVCLLGDPVRRSLYDYVVRQGRPVTRDEAGEGAGVDRSVAAYHLDRLVEDGLLAADFARPPGRGGPGAGRPAKRYQRAEGEVSVAVPPRDYRLAAELLVRAVQADPSGRTTAALQQAAGALGRDLAQADTADGGDADGGDFEGGGMWDELTAALERLGFEPYEAEGALALRNCPFHRLADAHPEVICAMNHALLGGLARALTGERVEACLTSSGGCCVTLVPAGGREPGGPARPG